MFIYKFCLSFIFFVDYYHPLHSLTGLKNDQLDQTLACIFSFFIFYFVRLFCITSSSILISHPSDFLKPSFIVGGEI